MQALFGTEYFGFIASAYAVTSAVLLALIVWIFLTYSNRRKTLQKLEKSGLKRASSQNG